MVDTDRSRGPRRNWAARSRGAVGNRAGSRRQPAEGRVREAQGVAENVFGQAKNDVRDAAYDFAEDAYERGGHTLHWGTGEVSHQVAEYPLASVLIADLVGVGLGLLVSAPRD